MKWRDSESKKETLYLLLHYGQSNPTLLVYTYSYIPRLVLRTVYPVGYVFRHNNNEYREVNIRNQGYPIYVVKEEQTKTCTRVDGRGDVLPLTQSWWS